ncbi:MAG: hypothetical protein Q7S32_00780 [bacterium]|nr:hypothetical protein [bacterium]
MTVAEKIKELTRNHLKNDGVALGQCLTAVGWVGGTVPDMTEEEGLIELSMADVAAGGFAVGLALAGRRPIYIVRYQGFQQFNSIIPLSYAAKSNNIWDVSCPIFIRSIGMDGGIGPVASGSHHSIFTRMPGIKVFAPMTPGEYQRGWDRFMEDDTPYCASEHRRSFSIDYEMPNRIHPQADITLYPISSTRLNALEAAATLESEGIVCNIVHLLWLKPFFVSETILSALSGSRHGGLVLDGDFENGVAKCLAYDIMQQSDKNVRVLALEERSAGFAPHLDNLPPTPQKICEYVRKLVQQTR